MRELIRMLIRYHLVILFILLESLALFLAVRNNAYPNVAFYQRYQGTKAKIDQKIYNVTQYLSLRDMNQKLLEENQRLHSEIVSNQYYKLDSLVFVDSLFSSQYEYIPSVVVSNSTKKQYNYITINAGRLKGVEPEMGVVSNKGVIGVVKIVTDHYATVIPVLNHSLKVSAKIKKNNYFGPLTWSGENDYTVNLEDIPYHVNIQKGDTVVTSGFSVIFPAGIPIGVIDEYNIDKGNFYEISVHLMTDFRNLRYAYVIKNKFKKEQIELEQTND